MVDGVGNYNLSLSPGDYAIGALHFNSPTTTGMMTVPVKWINAVFENASTIEGATVIQVAERKLGILILTLSMVKFLDLIVLMKYGNGASHKR